MLKRDGNYVIIFKVKEIGHYRGQRAHQWNLNSKNQATFAKIKFLC